MHTLNDGIKFLVSSILTVIIISASLVISTRVSGYYEYNILHPVNKEKCRCDCWDGKKKRCARFQDYFN